MASSVDPGWQDDILIRLIEIFKEDKETLFRVQCYLDEEEKLYKDDEVVPPVWNILRAALKSDDLDFEKLAERLADDTQKAESDESYKEKMRLTYVQMIDAFKDPLPENQQQGFNPGQLADGIVNTTAESADLWISTASDVVQLFSGGQPPHGRTGSSQPVLVRIQEFASLVELRDFRQVLRQKRCG